ncbi:MAG: hypothetical protein C4547_02335 [Phycisphaerales bacterium]|nr:MAG: hypothetical protein C4547_02335 [Phycisphaerales bacterium]
MIRKGSIAVLSILAAAVMALWAVSTFGGVGFESRRDVPAPNASSQRTTLNVDLVNGLLIVRRETLTPGPIVRIAAEDSSWTVDFYGRGAPLDRGVATKPPPPSPRCTCPTFAGFRDTQSPRSRPRPTSG